MLIIFKKVWIFLFYFTLLFVLLIFVVFFDFFWSIIFGGNIKIINTTNGIFVGKIEFFQHKNLLHSEKFEISQNEKKKITVPDDFNDGDIKIFIEDNSWKEEFVISNDYLYSFNVNEKVFIKKENGDIKLEKNP